MDRFEADADYERNQGASRVPEWKIELQKKEQAARLAQEKQEKFTLSLVKEAEKSRSSKNYLENKGIVSKYGGVQYDEEEAALLNSVVFAQDNVDKLKKKLLVQERRRGEEKRAFEECASNLAELLIGDKESVDKNEIDSEISVLMESNEALAKELESMKEKLDQLKDFPFRTPKEVEEIVRSCRQNARAFTREVERYRVDERDIDDEIAKYNLTKGELEKQIATVDGPWTPLPRRPSYEDLSLF